MWSVWKQRSTKLAQNVVQPSSPDHPPPGMSWCFPVYSSSMCYPTQVWAVRQWICITSPIRLLIRAGRTTSFCLLTCWSSRHGRRRCNLKWPMCIKVLWNIYIIWSQEPVTCIEMSPYFENKITHEIYCFRTALVLLVRQAPPKGRGMRWTPKVAEWLSLSRAWLSI
jgi:hypothetical protein